MCYVTCIYLCDINGFNAFSCSVSLLNSIHSSIDGFLQYLLIHTTTDHTHLLPLSVLLHIIIHGNNDTPESSTILLAMREVVFPLLYSYSSGLQDISIISSTDNASLCQYRSVVTEYCLDKLCDMLRSNVKLLPTDDRGITLNNRTEYHEELQQLLNYLWSFCCTPLNNPDHYQ